MHSTDEFVLYLFKSLSGEISPEQQMELDTWIAQSNENQQIADDMRLIWQKSGRMKKQFTPNLDADFAQVLGKIQTDAPRTQLRVRPRIWMSAAAALLVLAACAWIFRMYQPQAAEMQQIAALNVEKQDFTLSDGTHVWLRKGAKLKFPKTFSGKNRSVQLDGEAFFEVTPDAAHPFHIDLIDGGSVEVLGTAFDVNTLQHSVSVRHGKVRYRPGAHAAGEVLLAGMKATFNPESAQLSLQEMPSMNEMAWQSGGLEFINTPLKVVVSDLERFYDVRIQLRNNQIQDCRYTAPLTSQPLTKVLKSIALVFDMRLEKAGDGSYILSGGNCR